MLTSKFFKPEEGVTYRYGNFCGAYHPKRKNGADDKAFAQQLEDIKPIDDIDRACQAHDICYVTVGMDWDKCDALLQRSLNPYDYAVADRTLNILSHPPNVPKPTGNAGIVTAFEPIAGSDQAHFKCANLAAEISYAFNFKFKQADQIASISNKALIPLSAGYGLTKLSGSFFHGFPESEGTCFFSDSTRDYVERNAVMGFFADIERSRTSKRDCVRRNNQTYKAVSCQAKYLLGSQVTKSRADRLYQEFIERFFPQSSFDSSTKGNF